MRIVHLSTHDVWGGAGIVAHRLHTELRALGEESTMFVAERHGYGSGVQAFVPPRDLKSRLLRTARRKSLRREMRRYTDLLTQNTEPFSDDRTLYGSDPFRQIPPFDILHLHWISGFLDLTSLFRWIPAFRPVLWTLHDMNPFTGGCHFDAGCKRHRERCGQCPKLGGTNANDLSHRVWKRKSQAYGGIPTSQLHLVAPCRWVADEAQHSSLLGRFPVTVIPHGVDTEAFAPRDRYFARAALGVPQDATVLVFAANNVSERRKGFSLLAEALSGLKLEYSNLFLLVIGDHAAVPELGIPCQTLGYVASDRLLSIVYSAADLCVVPALQETGPLIVIESMACGTPVLGFPAGDMPEMVRPGKTGLLVPSGDSAALRQGMRQLLACPEALAQMRAICREVAVREYRASLFAKRHFDLYRELITKN